MKLFNILSNKNLFLTIGVCIFFLQSALAQKIWKLVNSDDSIFIYKREGDRPPLKEIKVVSGFRSTLSGFVSFIQDVSAQPNYVYNCITSNVVKEISKQKLIFYQQIKVPWPFTNRDGVYQQHIVQDSATHIVTIYSSVQSESLPKIKNFVRVSFMKSSWVIKTNGDGTLNAEYYFYGDPGGSIPAWLTNMFITEGPNKTQKKMRVLVLQKKYQDAKIDFIID